MAESKQRKLPPRVFTNFFISWDELHLFYDEFHCEIKPVSDLEWKVNASKRLHFPSDNVNYSFASDSRSSWKYPSNNISDVAMSINFWLCAN